MGRQGFGDPLAQLSGPQFVNHWVRSLRKMKLYKEQLFLKIDDSGMVSLYSAVCLNKKKVLPFVFYIMLAILSTTACCSLEFCINQQVLIEF